MRQLEVLLFKTARARVTLGRMSLALALQMNGLGLALCTAMYSLMAASNSATLVNTPQRMRLSVMSRKKRSTMALGNPVGQPLDETYIRVKGQWKNLYRAVDKAGHTIDFRLTAKRARKAALRFLRKAIDQPGLPEKITLDKNGAKTAAIDDYNTDHETGIELRVAALGPQAKYLNNVVEQDHRAIKRQTRPMRGFKSFWCAAIIP